MNTIIRKAYTPAGRLIVLRQGKFGYYVNAKGFQDLDHAEYYFGRCING